MLFNQDRPMQLERYKSIDGNGLSTPLYYASVSSDATPLLPPDSILLAAWDGIINNDPTSREIPTLVQERLRGEWKSKGLPLCSRERNEQRPPLILHGLNPVHGIPSNHLTTPSFFHPASSIFPRSFGASIARVSLTSGCPRRNL